MKKRLHSNQNELMIVNPGLPNSEQALSLGQIFFGDDGYVYQIQGLEEEPTRSGLNDLYLGEDDTLYSLGSPELLGKYETETRGPPRQYFLGADGTLYEVI